MGKIYENKADHNQDFLDSIIQDYPTDYYDWKVTLQFYIALHRCYCVLDASGYVICNRHKDNIKNLEAINKVLSANLFKLFRNSRQARYEGFITTEAMNRINKINFDANKTALASIKSNVATYYPVTV